MNQTLEFELKEASENQDKKEKIILEKIYTQISNDDYEGIYNLISSLNNIWPKITTARITKIIKRTLESLPRGKNEMIITLIDSLINWAERENKKLLRLELECKKINALLLSKKYRECLVSIGPILKELKKFDDKENQIRVYVCESKAYYELKDMVRARSALTSARALAVSCYCSSGLQAQIDLLNGMLICDENNYSIAYSYFLEALDGFILSKDLDNASITVRYLLLSKIIEKKWEEIHVLLKNKIIQPFLKDEVVLILQEIAEICKKRDLRAYQEKNLESLTGDTFIQKHLNMLYNILLENNIIKIIEPYSNIKIELIVEKLGFSYLVIEDKIRKMILDGRIGGIIDNVNGSLMLFDEVNRKKNDVSLEYIQNLKRFVASIK